MRPPRPDDGLRGISDADLEEVIAALAHVEAFEGLLQGYFVSTPLHRRLVAEQEAREYRKGPPWIYPDLLNGWHNAPPSVFGHDPIRWREFPRGGPWLPGVEMAGRAVGGVMGTAVFRFPLEVVEPLGLPCQIRSLGTEMSGIVEEEFVLDTGGYLVAVKQRWE